MTENCPGHITGHQASGTSCIFGHFVVEKKKEVYSGAWISVADEGLPQPHHQARAPSGRYCPPCKVPSLADHGNKCV